MRVVPEKQLVGYEGEGEEGSTKKTDKKSPGFFEGLKLLLTKPYLLGIFFVITLYEIIVTIFDFQLKSMASVAFPAEPDMAAYLTTFAVTTGIVAWISVLLGINNIQRRLGMAASLLLMPILVGIAVFVLWFSPTLSIVFWIMVVAKAINYALNQPTLKQLYIPTSKDVQYKSQAWIEMFGSRGSKATGSVINNLKKSLFIPKYGPALGASAFLSMAAGISFFLIAIWLFVALFVAKTHKKATDEKRVVC